MSVNSTNLSADRIVWIDCEMTGLDIVADALVEVAAVVTDSELRVLDPGLDLVIHADDADLDLDRARDQPRDLDL